MAKSENEIKIILTNDEKNNLISAVKKLTVKKVGFGGVDLSEEETKMLDFIKKEL